MKSLRALPILLLALTTAGGHPTQKPKESSGKTKASSDGPKELRGLPPAKPAKGDSKSAAEHPLRIGVRIDAQDRLYVNGELVGTVEATRELRRRLRRAFRERRRLLDGPQGAKMDEAAREHFKSKAVTLQAPTSAKYATVVKIIDVLKAEGYAVGLVVDDPPRQEDERN